MKTTNRWKDEELPFLPWQRRWILWIIHYENVLKSDEFIIEHKKSDENWFKSHAYDLS